MPTPASPTTVTSSQRGPASARSQASTSRCSSRSRPTKRDACERSGCFADREEREGGDRLALPLQLERPLLSTSTAAPTSASVSAPISTSPGPAACSSRAATLTASPVASRSSVPVTTSPVLTPIRPRPELRQRVAHLDRRPAGAERVVLVRHRHAEHRHHRVADELLHRAAVRLDDPPHPLEVTRQERLQRLRIDRLAERRRADDVAEQHRHDLPVRADSHEPRLEHRRGRA